MPFGFHPAYLIILLAIVLIIFGPGKLPDLASGLGRSMREFRKASTDIQDELQNAIDRPAAPASPAAEADKGPQAPAAKP